MKSHLAEYLRHGWISGSDGLGYTSTGLSTNRERGRCGTRRGSAARLLEEWPAAVIGARVGYFDEGESIGNIPCIAASVKPSELATFQLGAPTHYQVVCRSATSPLTSKNRCRRCQALNRSIRFPTTMTREPATLSFDR